MKYMGSKRWMLQNGLGDLIAREVRKTTRFVDLFAGSGSVSTHVATKFGVPVEAYDLQTFSTVLTQAIVGRDSKIDPAELWAKWLATAQERQKIVRPPPATKITKAVVENLRSWCAQQSGLIAHSYGGHYFSAVQASWFDALLQTLPQIEAEKSVALAALICAASSCAAAPGHTAQPFQPTRTAKPFLLDAWRRDVLHYCKESLTTLCGQHAKVLGRAKVADANLAAASIAKGDLVFVDPPYSGVHYSRFYHVLETLARGWCSEVSGTGRYPVDGERPRSQYSLKSESSAALGSLFQVISQQGGKAIVTFPQRLCSNGLSGSTVITLASRYFEVEKHWVASKFSTLGGNNSHRDARRATRELILVLRPR